MEDYNIIDCKLKEEFYYWLKENNDKENECFLECKKGKIKSNNNILYYIDAVYMALCFGWIDSTQKVIDGIDFLAKNGFLLRINMVVGTHNIDEVENMISFCQSHNCDLKLLDIVSVPLPFGERGNYFVDLTPLEHDLMKKCDNIIAHVYTKSFGVPCVKYQFGNTNITVKNGTKGTHYDRDGVCKDCRFFPCHEGLYDIFALPDGRICSCRWTEKQVSVDSAIQLQYLIEAFQRASFFVGLNNISVNMKTRPELM